MDEKEILARTFILLLCGFGAWVIGAGLEENGYPVTSRMFNGLGWVAYWESFRPLWIGRKT